MRFEGDSAKNRKRDRRAWLDLRGTENGKDGGQLQEHKGSWVYYLTTCSDGRARLDELKFGIES